MLSCFGILWIAFLFHENIPAAPGSGETDLLGGFHLIFGVLPPTQTIGELFYDHRTS